MKKRTFLYIPLILFFILTMTALVQVAEAVPRQNLRQWLSTARTNIATLAETETEFAPLVDVLEAARAPFKAGDSDHAPDYLAAATALKPIYVALEARCLKIRTADRSQYTAEENAAALARDLLSFAICNFTLRGAAREEDRPAATPAASAETVEGDAGEQP